MTVRDDFFDDDDRRERRAQWVRTAVPIVAFGLIVFLGWFFLHGATGVRREAPRVQTIIATLPPPPPPPPKEKPPEEPQKKIEEVPKPNEAKPLDAPKPMTINGPAQAGNDAFNIGAGDGGGSVVGGTGFGDAAYTRYMGSALQQAIQQDDSVNRLVFTAEVAVWIDGSGHLTQARILKSSGDDKTDSALIAALQSMPALDQAPPSSVQFPQRVAIRGRRMG